MHITIFNDNRAELTKTAWQFIPELQGNLKFSDDDMRFLLGDMPQEQFWLVSITKTLKSSMISSSDLTYCQASKKSLIIIFSSDLGRVYTWIDRENTLPSFSGITPREYLLKGDFESLEKNSQYACRLQCRWLSKLLEMPWPATISGYSGTSRYRVVIDLAKT